MLVPSTDDRHHDQRHATPRPVIPSLTASDMASLTERLPGWTVKSVDGIDRLERAFVFASYGQVVAFAKRLSDLADASNHHPTILNEVDRITVNWWTFTTRSLTHLDVTMAEKTDRLYEAMIASE
jgi:4a-hydroxytetrahydrobiopterin dehydratase